MKKSIFVAIAFIAVTTSTSQLFAQDAAGKSSGYDLKKNVKARIVPTDTGCTIAFEYDVKSPRDAASGLPTGKKGYDYYKAQSDFSVSASDNSVTEITNPKDAGSGLMTGKRMHNPLVITKEVDKTAGSGAGAGKVSMQDFHFTMRCGGKSSQVSCDDGECEIPINCPDGTCSLTADWSWGASNSGSGRCASSFILTIENGGCTAMAINEKGLPGDKKPKKTTTK